MSNEIKWERKKKYSDVSVYTYPLVTSSHLEKKLIRCHLLLLGSLNKQARHKHLYIPLMMCAIYKIASMPVLAKEKKVR